MVFAHRKLAGALAVAVLLVGHGCSESTPQIESGSTKATVKGTVRIKGAPATGGTVVFDPSNYKRKSEPPRTAPIGKDGTYTVETLTGPNRVSLTGPEVMKALPEAQFQKLDYDVKSGDNSYDISLPVSGK